MNKKISLLLAVMLIASGIGILSVPLSLATGETNTIANVVHGNLTTITISPNTTVLSSGGSQPFVATVTDGNNTIEDVNVAWSVVDGTIGTLSSSSGITDAKGNTSTTFTADTKAGSTTIKASATNESETIIEGSATITVSELKQINVNESLIDFGTVKVGETSKNQVIHINNTGNVPTSVSITPSTMTSGSNTIPGSSISINPTPIPVIPIGGQVLENAALTIPPGTVIGTYTGTISIVAT